MPGLVCCRLFFVTFGLSLNLHLLSAHVTVYVLCSCRNHNLILIGTYRIVMFAYARLPISHLCACAWSCYWAQTAPALDMKCALIEIISKQHGDDLQVRQLSEGIDDWYFMLTFYRVDTSLPQEDHGQPLFGVQFNWFLEDKYFATVGSNRVCVFHVPTIGILASYPGRSPRNHCMHMHQSYHENLMNEIPHVQAFSVCERLGLSARLSVV